MGNFRRITHRRTVSFAGSIPVLLPLPIGLEITPLIFPELDRLVGALEANSRRCLRQSGCLGRMSHCQSVPAAASMPACRPPGGDHLPPRLATIEAACAVAVADARTSPQRLENPFHASDSHPPLNPPRSCPDHGQPAGGGHRLRGEVPGRVPRLPHHLPSTRRAVVVSDADHCGGRDGPIPRLRGHSAVATSRNGCGESAETAP